MDLNCAIIVKKMGSLHLHLEILAWSQMTPLWRNPVMDSMLHLLVLYQCYSRLSSVGLACRETIEGGWDMPPHPSGFFILSPTQEEDGRRDERTHEWWVWKKLLLRWICRSEKIIFTRNSDFLEIMDNFRVKKYLRKGRKACNSELFN